MYRQLQFCAQYLTPIANSIAKQLQSAVSIIITQPMPETGEVEVCSVHVNWPGGLSTQTWPVHNPMGYENAEKSAVLYGNAIFHEYAF